ncbi:hypothetical protein [Parasitella parasitica]|uniref:Uncharacterized protein n=1 Tax=Parasitella parasitica TaxID=35722 RepID=A0A0B7NPE1_9FUNG|nr:hypothetical protein [Parasitella parasitica]
MRSKKRQRSIYEPGSARINDPATIQDASEYRKRLPKGIVKEAEASINATEGTITKLLSVNLTKVKKPSVQYWRDYITENFEDLKQSVVGEASSSKTTAQIDGNGSKSDDGDDSSSGFNSDDDVQEDTEDYRVYSTSLSSIIRKDLSNEVRIAVLNTIKNTLEQAFNYASAYSKHVLKTALLLMEYEFTIVDGKIQLTPTDGRNALEVLPSAYLDGNVFVPKPLNRQCIQTQELSQEYDSLFQLPHLELINSSYFGPKGTRSETLEESQFHKAIVQVQPRTESEVITELPPHVMGLTPIIAPTNFHALSIDADILFSFFGSTTTPEKMTIRDFEGDSITSGTAATSNKDAVFSSLFDMEKLKIKTAIYGLSLANKLSVLPGMKCVRLYGAKFFCQPRQQQATSPTPQRSLDDDRKLKLKEESKHLHIQLRDAKAKLNEFLSSNNVLQLKNDWKNATVEERPRVYREVEVSKTNKRNLINTVLGIQQELSLNRQQIFELNYPSSPPETHQQVVSNEPCCYKAEDCVFEANLPHDVVRFSGTDNGIIKVTETVSFGIERFAYHLDLYNKFQGLEAEAIQLQAEVARLRGITARSYATILVDLANLLFAAKTKYLLLL